MNIPPHFDLEFLLWFKEKTEQTWLHYVPRDFFGGPVGGLDWQPGTKWKGGLTDSEIAVIENKWKIRFPPPYRLFLQVLHCPDRPAKGALFKGQNLEPAEKPLFYDWQKNDAVLKEMFEWPLDGLCFDIEHNLWLPSWGTKPTALAERKNRIRELFQSAPTLIPIHGHRYMMPQATSNGYPIFSVYQSDIVFYGKDLRQNLLDDWSRLLGRRPSPLILTKEEAREYCRIPFWGELIKRSLAWKGGLD